MNSAASGTPSLTRTLTDKQIAGFRGALERELESARELESRLDADIQVSLESRRSTPTDEAEDPEGSSLAFEGAQTTSMLKQTVRHAAEITAALDRLDDGSYGICEACSGHIATGRLEARPASALCISCASVA